MKTQYHYVSKNFIVLLVTVLFLSATPAQDIKDNHNNLINTSSVDNGVIDINKLVLSFLNNGEIGICEYEESSILYSSGLYLSGITNDTTWGNGAFASSLFHCYQPGKVGSDPNDPINRIYVVKSNDLPFGASWQNWADAVSLGALFYDGDNDGIYNPVDLNGNSVWDINEDRPDLIGDITAWCVYNDGVLSPSRIYHDNPRSIEVHLSIFGFSTLENNLDNSLFFRYRIFNRSSEDWEGVYFSSVADPDIGDFNNDLAGCDSLLNLGYTYNIAEEDTIFYGANPPAFGINLLQRPATYVPGDTFIDNNLNNIYDKGIDTPLDTAIYRYGNVLGIEKYPGAKNNAFNSFTSYYAAVPFMGDPDFLHILRGYQIGGESENTEPIDVCTWSLGNGASLANYCAEINPKFMYSGDPVTDEGWLNTLQGDQRMMINTGPFTVKQNKSVDIVVSYVVGRGNNPIESVTKMKETAVSTSIEFYNNFIETPLGVESETYLPQSFKLFQNYPNPFNPSTNIQYTISNKQLVQVRVYDILESEVATLVNQEQNAGSYSVDFNAKYLSSGVYFYRLQAGSFVQTRKMIILK